MNDVRIEILKRRLDRILDEYPRAGASQQAELVREAMLIYRDIQAADCTPASPPVAS